MSKQDEPTPEQKRAWDEYVKAQAGNKKRQAEVMRELEKQAKDDDDDEKEDDA